MPLAYIHELTGDRPGHDLPGGYPGHPSGGPIIPPPLPGVWPKPGEPTHPIEIPPPASAGGEPSNPIVIPQPPPGINPPIQLPPPGIYPPPTGLPPGKYAILAKVLGSDTTHWVVVDTSLSAGTPLPPAPAPK